MKSLLFALVLSTGCASAAATIGQISDTALPRIGAGLQAAEALYVASCKPELAPELDKVCASSKTAINDAVDGYTEVDNAVKAAQ